MDARLPWYQRYSDGLIRGLNRIGVAVGPVVVLTLNGRTTGELRSTPVTPVEVDDRLYLVAAIDTAQWAQNARADGDAAIDRAGAIESVHLVEVTDPGVKERVVVAYGQRAMPGRFLKRVGAATERTPEAFAKAAEQTAVFEVAAPRIVPAPTY